MKTLNTIYLWLMLAACMLALAGCVEENVSGTGEGGCKNIRTTNYHTLPSFRNISILSRLLVT